MSHSLQLLAMFFEKTGRGRRRLMRKRIERYLRGKADPRTGRARRSVVHLHRHLAIGPTDIHKAAGKSPHLTIVTLGTEGEAELFVEYREDPAPEAEPSAGSGTRVD